MPAYTWSCLACQESNPGSRSSCSRCGCPAEANAREIELASMHWRRRAGLPAIAPVNPERFILGLPLLALAGGLCFLLGAVMLVVNMGPSTSAFGGLMLALAALCASSWRRPDPTAAA